MLEQPQMRGRPQMLEQLQMRGRTQMRGRRLPARSGVNRDAKSAPNAVTSGAEVSLHRVSPHRMRLRQASLPQASLNRNNNRH